MQVSISTSTSTYVNIYKISKLNKTTTSRLCYRKRAGRERKTLVLRFKVTCSNLGLKDKWYRLLVQLLVVTVSPTIYRSIFLWSLVTKSMKEMEQMFIKLTIYASMECVKYRTYKKTVLKNCHLQQKVFLIKKNSCQDIHPKLCHWLEYFG